eukprot:CAMPEP_0170588300 /NCGR_PEP_ID=MMETSP0224-20130122/10756_1 /TAXON_ID=285029 /ORGANISM="Togula jolla, Strain CCCM 725" /LENGTH=49 /DNA_ID= /DNA_START= /DNA_END= /DNA_ORIENTATION=
MTAMLALEAANFTPVIIVQGSEFLSLELLPTYACKAEPSEVRVKERCER